METEGGNICATQTACNLLHYRETLEESKAIGKGRKVTEANLRSELNLEEDADINKAINDWIKEKSERLKQKKT
jgi:hypothetical protein